MDLECPSCANTDPAQIVGVEVAGIYDGVLYWLCRACDWAWSRDWTGYSLRSATAHRYVDAHNLTRPSRRPDPL